VRRFEAATGFTVETSLGSTGQLYAQIENGAPFDVFLAADSEHPWRLEQTRLGVAGTRFTYAVGRLALYAPQWDSVRSGAAALDTHALNLSGWELGLEPGLAVYARVRSVAVPD
jgi:molybdate transport system substrate-binding protein